MLRHLFVLRRQQFPSPGTFPHRNVPVCPHPGTLRHLFVPRRQQFPSTGTFPHRNVPACPHPGTLRHLSCPGGWYFLFVKFGGNTCRCQTAFYKGALLPLRQFCSGRNTIPSQTALLWGWPFPPNFTSGTEEIKCLVGKKNPSPIPLQDGFFYHIFVCGRP